MGTLLGMIREFPWAEHAQMFAGNFSLNKWELFQFFAPVFAFWSVCIFYDILDNSSSPLVKRYRFTDAKRGNAVSKSHVLSRVITTQVIETSVGLIVLFFDPHMCQKPEKSWPRTLFDLALAVFVFDAWMYWIHRLMHTNKFLYNNVHADHHQLYAPYSYASYYYHPVEAFLLNSVGALGVIYISGMGCKSTGFLFTVASMKGVCDHSGYAFPLNPVDNLFAHNYRSHLVHHDLRGFNHNYSLTFFTAWDRIMGTYKHPNNVFTTSTKRVEGSAGLQTISEGNAKKTT
jgi:sphinganine C4-monooxygenase